jgi:hypothetical protein
MYALSTLIFGAMFVLLILMNVAQSRSDKKQRKKQREGSDIRIGIFSASARNFFIKSSPFAVRYSHFMQKECPLFAQDRKNLTNAQKNNIIEA